MDGWSLMRRCDGSLLGVVCFGPQIFRPLVRMAFHAQLVSLINMSVSIHDKYVLNGFLRCLSGSLHALTVAHLCQDDHADDLAYMYMTQALAKERPLIAY